MKDSRYSAQKFVLPDSNFQQVVPTLPSCKNKMKCFVCHLSLLFKSIHKVAKLVVPLFFATKRVLAMAVIFLLPLCLLVACKTDAHLVVPGEPTITRRKISSEYLAIADEYYKLEKFDKAIEFYEKSIGALKKKNAPLYWAAYYKEARAYAMTQKYSTARKMFFVLLGRDPKNIDLRLTLAYLYAMEGDLERAKVIYAFLWRDNKDNPDTLVNYIDILIASEEYQKAGTYLDVLREKFSDNTNIKVFQQKLDEMLPKKDIELDDDEKNNVLPDSADTK